MKGVTLDDFYKNANILITGGTGFMGKVLIEKLLRTQTNINKVYILIRPKKGKNVENRAMKDIFDKRLFERLRSINEEYMNKVVVVEGDICEPQLGLNQNDVAVLLDEINIVFNVAASLSMNAKLKYNVKYNIKSVIELLKLCRRMKNLRSCVIVSTAYSNCNRSVIEEKIYEPRVNYSLVLQMCEEIDEDMLSQITEQLLDGHPNTYTLSKALMESILLDYTDLPIILHRPAIVVGSYLEPVPGWVDNYNGASGISAAVGMGILRVMSLGSKKKTNWIPVDLCVNSLICSAWHGIQNRSNMKNNLTVYNYAGDKSKCTLIEYMDAMAATDIKSNQSIWKPVYICIETTYVLHILQFFLHFLPALIIDAGLALSGKKLRLNKIYQEKIYPVNNVLKFFAMHEWTFEENNTYAMWDSMTPEEKQLYPFNMDMMDRKTQIRNLCIGIKLYLYNEKLEDNEKALKRHKILNVVHYGFLLLFWGFIIWILYKLWY